MKATSKKTSQAEVQFLRHHCNNRILHSLCFLLADSVLGISESLISVLAAGAIGDVPQQGLLRSVKFQQGLFFLLQSICLKFLFWCSDSDPKRSQDTLILTVALTSSNLSLHCCTQMRSHCFYLTWTHWEVHVKASVAHLDLEIHLLGRLHLGLWNFQRIWCQDMRAHGKIAKCMDRDSWKSQRRSFFWGFWGKLPWWSWIIHNFWLYW